MVRRYREALQLTQEELAKACGDKPNRSYIQQLEQGRLWVPSPEYFNTVVRVLDMPGWEYFDALGYKMGVAQDAILPAFQYAAQQLDPEQQRALLPQLKMLLKYAGGDGEVPSRS